MSFGFGSNNNTNNFGGFGGSNTGSGFGANNASTGGPLFGGNTATSGGFSGFGSSNNSNASPFGGNKPAFGTNTTTSGGGLFGNSANNTATSGGFGSGAFGNTSNPGGFGSSTGGGLFGQQNKPATTGFGATNTGGSLFGGGGNTTGGFGASNTAANNPFSSNTNTNTGFGGSNTGGNFTFGGSTATNSNNGTANPPFTAVTEKEQSAGGASSQISQYQSITFQQPYQNKSFEELRTEDYAQGRRFGNTNGQAGGFGQSTGFGGFGTSNASSGGGLFGSNTATSGNTGFGANNTNTNTNTLGAFGGTNTGGGLFQNKPAGGLFGAQTSGTTTGGFGSTSGSGGGLFGSGGNTFGNTNTGGGLFGANNQQQQNKPAFSGFGSTNTTSGFGANTNTGGGLFGGANNTNTGGGLFGNQNNQQQNPFGATNTNTGGGLFGNQNKPAGGSLFGGNTNTNTGGGLFGAQNNQQQSNPFGQSTNTGGGLFGAQNQNQNKPPGTGLFGGNTNAGSSLFVPQNNQNPGSNLFGANTNAGSSLFGNQNKPAGGSLFGNNPNTSNTNAGLSLFGNQQNQQNNTGSSLFGSLNQNQNQQNTNAGSLFGGSLGQSQQPAQNQLHASLTGAPYGNEQLFSSLAAPSPPVGPLATPLSGARPAPRKTPSLLASARVNTPVYSPRAGSLGRNAGYGFSYSTYGTPGSAFTSGSLTPGASSLLKPTGSFGSALTSRLNKSFSTSNLRSDSISSEGRSLLRPPAFSPEGTPGRYSNGNVRKLKIDRSLRSDLFGPEPRAIDAAKENDAPSLRKRVSFESPAEKDTTTPEANSSNALVRTEDREESESPGLMRAGPSKSQTNRKGPEMEQVNGALTTVPEETEAPRASSAPTTKAQAEKSKKSEVGDYWTKPALKDLKNMSRQQLKNVGSFVVGREGVGRIEFGSVDLTNTPLEDICGSIVQLNPRSATVYQDDQDKPAMGKALNVPSTIYLENSWPRSQGGRKPVNVKSGKEYDKHIARLKRVGGTQFLNYNPDTGVWSFKVDHFTTYGLDDDDDESEYLEDSRMEEVSSPLSDVPETPGDHQDLTLQSVETGTGEMEDTFQFKLDRRSQLSLPGGFESEGITYDYEDHTVDEGMDEDHLMSGGLGDVETDDPFVSGGPVQNPSPGAMERYHSSMIEDQQLEEDDDQEMPGSFIAEPKAPRSILKHSTGLNAFASPEKLATESWEEQLQRTMSPKKRDRQALKEMQQNLMRARGDDVVESPFKRSMLGQSVLNQSYLAQKSSKKTKVTSSNKDANKDLGKSQAFRTAMDLMDSMYAQEKSGRKATAGAKDFEYPYPKKPRLSASDDMSPNEAAWHDSMKPNFDTNGTLVYSVPRSAPQASGDLSIAMAPLVGEHKDVCFAKFIPPEDITPKALLLQKQQVTTIDISSGFPVAQYSEDMLFSALAEKVDERLAIAQHEKAIWQLCSILYDPPDVACAKYVDGVPDEQIEQLVPRMRMDALSSFWSQLVAPSVHDHLKRARTAEEKALLHLTQNNIVGACETLVNAKCFKLATLVSQLPGTAQSRAMIKSQIEAWRSRNDWSEMSDPVRALYSILAGELCVVEGKTGTSENRVAAFNIAEKFELSWQQSFALRLYFGGFQTIEEATLAYADDLQSKRERIRPTTTWHNGAETNDILAELLRPSTGEPDTSNLFKPLAVSGSAVNTRLTWQLALHLSIQGHCTLSDDELDRITYAFASELENAGKFVISTWILLHIRDSTARQKAIVSLLDRHGDKISTPSDGTRDTFEELTQDNQIPSASVWRAKALYAKGGLQNPGLQAEWLLSAGDVDAAHEVLCTTVGPQAVIEQEYEWLSNLLQHFGGRRVDGWEQGGQVFVDFLRLVRAQPSNRQNADQEATVQRLRRGLAAIEEDRMTKRSLEERVAIIQMSKAVNEYEDGEKAGMDESLGARGLEADMLRRYQQAMGLVA